jgi:hypothetical protein
MLFSVSTMNFQAQFEWQKFDKHLSEAKPFNLNAVASRAAGSSDVCISAATADLGPSESGF